MSPTEQHEEMGEVGVDTSGTPGMADASSDAGVAEVVRKLCPVLRMHHEEKHFPCSAEWFIERAELRYLTVGMKQQDVYEVIAKEGEITEEILREEPKKPKYPDLVRAANLQLYIKEQHAGGSPVDKLNDVPIYAHVKRVMSPDMTHVEAMEINYMTLYSWNGDYPIFGLPFAKAGSHPGDWEHLTVRTDAAGEPQAVWFNAHRNRDGCWMPWEAVPVTACGRPIAYVAKHGHGIYPTPGLQARVMLAANDRTSDTGPVWAPNKVVLIQNPEATKDKTAAPNRGTSFQMIKPTRTQSVHKQKQEAACTGGDCLPEVVVDSTSAWTAFPGRWGEITAPMLQGWYKQCEPPVSRTKLQRLFHFIDEKPLPEEIYKQTTAVSAAVTTTVTTAVNSAVDAVKS